MGIKFFTENIHPSGNISFPRESKVINLWEEVEEIGKPANRKDLRGFSHIHTTTTTTIININIREPLEPIHEDHRQKQKRTFR